MSVRSIQHATEGLARPCSANDMFLVAGGLQCGNCLAHNVPGDPRPKCAATTSDNKPCPLRVERKDDTLCWIHKSQRSASASAT